VEVDDAQPLAADLRVGLDESGPSVRPAMTQRFPHFLEDEGVPERRGADHAVDATHERRALYVASQRAYAT
jgi:hypothetical protein